MFINAYEWLPIKFVYNFYIHGKLNTIRIKVPNNQLKEEYATFNEKQIELSSKYLHPA